MNAHFFAMLSRMKYIYRWSLMRNTKMENICEHSHDVAVIAHALALLQNGRYGGAVRVERCVLLALYHDAPEILTGDLPTPVKYDNSSLLDAFRVMEENAAERLLNMLPEDLESEYHSLLLPNTEDTEELRIVKAADKIAALIKCIEELKQGNAEFKEAYRSTKEAIYQMALPAAECFLEEFLPSYELTLDELK